jgi:integrase
MLGGWLSGATGRIPMARRQQPEVKERTPWHKSENGCWSLSLGERGYRVLVRQRKPGGTFFRVTWIPNQGRSQASLHTCNRTEARQRAEAFCRALVISDCSPLEAAPLTLEGLWNRYQQEAPSYRKNAEKTQKEKQRTAAYLLAGFGRKKVVADLCVHDTECFIEKRERGLALDDGKQLKPAGRRTVENDLQLLRTLLNWATTVKVGGQWLLRENPLRGFAIPKEENPRRAVATYDRFLQTLEAVRQLGAEAPQQRGRRKWLRIELALVITEATGCRLGSLRGLRWADWNFEAPSVRFRPEFEKRKRGRTIPVTREVADEVKSLQLKLEAFGDGWLFPRTDGSGPWPREVFDQALRKAEMKAGLPKLDGTLWHGYRRKWATERKAYSPVDVMAAGGWRDLRTLQNCYQQADEATVMTVMACPTKLMSNRSSSVA